MKSTRALGLAVVASLALGALLYRPASAPAMQEPTAPATGQQIAGISCDAQEGQRIHIHQHLVILDHGKEVHIPENVGQPAGRRCLYWLHTHTPDGIIHIEAPLNRTGRLLQDLGSAADPHDGRIREGGKGKKSQGVGERPCVHRQPGDDSAESTRRCGDRGRAALPQAAEVHAVGQAVA
jgi:hypothetical protein